MSPFNQCLQICQTDDAKEYFRLIYWARNSRNRDAKERKRIKACDFRDTLEEQIINRAHAAVGLWNRLKPRAKLRIPQRTSMDHHYDVST